MAIKIGVMQGRLSPPIHNTIQAFPENSWENEFELARNIGLDSIEWVFDTYEKNPIMNNQLEKIKNNISKYRIDVNSVCADYFMVNKLFNESDYNINKNLEVLQRLAVNCSKVGIKIIEIPLVDISSLKSEQNKNELINNMEKILPKIQDLEIIIALETDLPPNQFIKLLNRFEDIPVYANYDTGNSASLGYNVKEELKILKNKIKNIHLKDRIIHGKTVSFGLGDTQFEDFFKTLKEVNYSGELIIQGAREEGVTPEENCLKYLNFTKQYLDKYCIK